ncbi:methionine synthase [Quadrisphaera sp. GCM10027208]|uniref:methionine synthase n=1 Tax=Quadrisphaera sp. GCM10027208 TaxID=3273423 RepID=UPI0036077650
MTRATGIGSWPGADPLEAARTVLGELGAGHLPHLVELPARGPGADMTGRAAALLVELPVDLQPTGWRLVDRPGRDLERARALLRADLDALAEAADGWTGELKVQVCGPWTLASTVRLARGERVLGDTGARRDLAVSLAEGVAQHVREVQRLVPGARVVVQVDEPGLPAVLAGHLATSSGWGRLPAVDRPEATEALRSVLSAATGAGAAGTAVHCCAAEPPVALLRDAGAGALSVDVSLLGDGAWESVAVAVESGVALWAGAVPTPGPLPSVTAVVDAVRRPWARVGLPDSALADVVLSPACGLAGSSPAHARAVLARVVEAAGALTEAAA